MVLHIYVCAYAHEPQHKTNGRERVREEQILRNKRDKRVGQSESNGEEIWITGGVEDKVTIRAHKQKRRKLENDFTRERVGDYNNDGLRGNNEHEKSGNDKSTCAERALFFGGGVLIALIVCDVGNPISTHSRRGGASG